MMQPTGQTMPAPALHDLQDLYAGWIKRIALLLKARMPWADLDELLQWGALGMLEALQRFDPSLGVEFQAFAMRRVRGTMINGLRREGMLRRGEAVFDAEVVDNAAVSDGFVARRSARAIAALGRPHHAGRGAAPALQARIPGAGLALL